MASTNYQPRRNRRFEVEMPLLLQVFMQWLGMFLVVIVFSVLITGAIFSIRDEGVDGQKIASSQVRSELLAKKVCHTETAFCQAQQVEYSKLMEQAVLEPEATAKVLKEKARLAQTKSFEMASQIQGKTAISQ